MFAAISTVKVCTIPGMVSITPVSGRTPVTTSPHPVVVAPSPAATHPDVSWCGTSRNDLHDWRGHWCRHNHGGRCHHDRDWGRYHRHGNREAKVDTHMNPSVDRGDSQRRQGRYCDDLFHSHYCFDARDRESRVINRFPFCNRVRRWCPQRQPVACLASRLARSASDRPLNEAMFRWL